MKTIILIILLTTLTFPQYNSSHTGARLDSAIVNSTRSAIENKINDSLDTTLRTSYSTTTAVKALISDTADVLRTEIDTTEGHTDLSMFEGNADQRLIHWKYDFILSQYRYVDNAVILHIGDSYVHPSSDKTRGRMQKIMGDGGIGYIDASARTYESTTFATVSLTNWTAGTDDALSIHGNYIVNDNTTDVVKVVSYNDWNYLKIHYKQSSGAGEFTYKIGYSGTYSDTVDCDGSTSPRFSLKDYGSTVYDETDTLYIKAVSGTVRIYGFVLTNDNSGALDEMKNLEYHSIGIGGSAISEWITGTQSSWDSLITVINPSLVIISFYEENGSGLYADLDSLVASIRDAKEETDILVISPHQTANDAQAIFNRNNMKWIADKNNIAFLDFYNKIGGAQDLTDLGLTNDGVHLVAYGLEVAAIELTKLLIYPTYKYSEVYVNTKLNLANGWTFEKIGSHFYENVVSAGENRISFEKLTSGRFNVKAYESINLYFDQNNNSTSEKFSIFDNAGGRELFTINGAATADIYFNGVIRLDGVSTPSATSGDAKLWSTTSGVLQSINGSGKVSTLYIQSGTGTFASAGTLAVSFAIAEANTSYMVIVTGNVGETFFITDKTVNGFTINSSNATSTANIDWVLVR